MPFAATVDHFQSHEIFYPVAKVANLCKTITVPYAHRVHALTPMCDFSIPTCAFTLHTTATVDSTGVLRHLKIISVVVHVYKNTHHTQMIVLYYIVVVVAVFRFYLIVHS